MDYCHQCRRHLNGALACAGCGTPAWQLRGPAPGPDTGAGERSVPPGQPGGNRPPEGARDPGAEILELGEVSWDAQGPGGTDSPARAAAPGGRSRRGRTRTGRGAAANPRAAGRRARRRRGRNVFVGVAGLVLAGGALSLAELALESGGDGSAATVKEEESGRVEPLPRPEGTRDDAAPEPPGKPSGRPDEVSGSRGSGRPAATASGRVPGPLASRPATPEAPPEPRPSGATPSGPSAGPGPRPGGSTAPAPPPSGPPQPTPTPSPTPGPTPTETCSPFLWWCL
ncbi:SCO2400 family protein [Streptomyces tsukubensis]|uniref:SCO2400 family protein n=1 Tax=Streptomyces tsukubensis TaxID=83656 RepID=UPI00344F9C5B